MTEQPTATEKEYETIKIRKSDKLRLKEIKSKEGRSHVEIFTRALDAYLVQQAALEDFLENQAV